MFTLFILSQGLLIFPCSANEQVHRKLERSMARTADQNRPKGYSIPWNAMLSILTVRNWLIGTNHCSGLGWALVSGCLATPLCITSLFWVLFLSFFLLYSFIIIYYFYYYYYHHHILNQLLVSSYLKGFTLFVLHSPPHSTRGCGA